MKTLSLLRHAHAEASKLSEEDIDRPLSARGEREARSIAERFESASAARLLCLCSAAKRAVETLNVLREAEHWPGDAEIEVEGELYLASSATLQERLSWIDDEVLEVLVIAHNPGIGLLALEMAGSGETAKREQLASGYPPAALAVLQLDTGSWEGVQPAGGKLVDLIFAG